MELFQHYLIDHQDNLVAASESESSRGGKPDPKLQKEIADLEKSVLGNYKVSIILSSGCFIFLQIGRVRLLVCVIFFLQKFPC